MDPRACRLAALDGFIADYEATNGEITLDEIDEAVRRARARTVIVRRSPETRSPQSHL